MFFLCYSFVSNGQESLPLFQPEFIQRNPSGPKYQVGDRIQLMIPLPVNLTQDLTSVSLKAADDQSPLDDAGWFLDPSPQLINGSLRFIVSPVQTGTRTLPPLLILKNNSTPIGKTSPVTVDVESMNAKPDQTPSLLDVQSLPIPLKLWLLILFGILILVGLAYFAYRKWKSRKPAPTTIPTIVPPPTPDHVMALKELALLYEQCPYSKENLKPVAFGVSQILKNYFSSRFKIDARESTTDEMIALLKGVSLSERDLLTIKELFKNLDLIKFTELFQHDHFQRADYLEFKDHARTLIEQWAPREVNR